MQDLPPEAKALLTGRLPLPVAQATGRVTYRDSVLTTGIPAERTLQAYYGFVRRLLAPDYPLIRADTLNLPKPQAPAAPGEQVTVGSAQVYDFENPMPSYVPGISPPLDPRATYPSYPYASFTVRLRMEANYCHITLTDVRLRMLPFDYPLKRMGLYGRQEPALARRPPGPSIEGSYARWLAGPKRRPAPLPAARPLPLATEAEARRLDFTMRGILGSFRREMNALAPRQVQPPGVPATPASR